MMSHTEVYQAYNEEYDLLIAREDYQKHLLPAIREILPLEGLRAVELGAGTGRLTLMLAPYVQSICAFDLSRHMLELAEKKLVERCYSNWRLGRADHRSIPLPAGYADLVISAWSISYLFTEHEHGWQLKVDDALREMGRLLRREGTVMIIESLGTDCTEPSPPTPRLAEYYAHLEKKGFRRKWVRTDYQFFSQAEADRLLRFFFGDDCADHVRSRESSCVPECTGIWWRIACQ